MTESDHNGAILFQAGAPARAAKAEMVWAERTRGQIVGDGGKVARRPASRAPGHSEEGGTQVRTTLAKGHPVSKHA